MIDERLEEQASLYVLGELPETEVRAFEDTLHEDAELRKLVAELGSVTEAFAGSVTRVEPPPALKEKLLARIERREKIVSLPTAPAKQSFIWLPWALAACFAVICAVLASRENSLQARVDELNQLAKNLESATNNLQQTVIALQETNRMADLRIAMLGSLLSEQPKAIAVSLWDEEKQTGVFVVQNLKPLPKDKDYQLWVIDPQYQTPVDAGVFQVDDKGNVRIQFKAKQIIKTAKTFAVTQEVKGGAPTPNLSAMVLAGS